MAGYWQGTVANKKRNTETKRIEQWVNLGLWSVSVSVKGRYQISVMMGTIRCENKQLSGKVLWKKSAG